MVYQEAPKKTVPAGPAKKAKQAPPTPEQGVKEVQARANALLKPKGPKSREQRKAELMGMFGKLFEKGKSPLGGGKMLGNIEGVGIKPKPTPPPQAKALPKEISKPNDTTPARRSIAPIETTRYTETTPEQFKQEIEKLVKQFDIALKEIKRVATTVTEDGITSRVEYDSFKVYGNPEHITQKDAHYLANALKNSALTLKKQIGITQLNKISGVLIALQRMNKGSEADRLANRLQSAADKWNENQDGSIILKNALAYYIDVSGIMYAGGGRSVTPRK